AGVRELKADDDVVRRAEAILVRTEQRLAEFSEASLVLVIDDKLVRIRAAIGAYRHGFAAIDHTRAALTEPLPAAVDFVGDGAGRSGVPAFHRLDCPAIGDSFAVDRDAGNRLRERRIRTAGNGILARQLDMERSNVPP